MGGRWYRDSVKENINPALALEAAGGMSKAMQKLAKIPLDIDKNSQIDAERQYRVYLAELKSRTDLSIAEKRAAAMIKKAELGLEGDKVTAGSRKYVADRNKEADDYSNKVKRENNKNTYGTLERNDKRKGRRLVAEYKGKAYLEQMKRKSARLKEEAKNKVPGDVDLGDWSIEKLDAVASTAKKK